MPPAQAALFMHCFTVSFCCSNLPCCFIDAMHHPQLCFCAAQDAKANYVSILDAEATRARYHRNEDTPYFNHQCHIISFLQQKRSVGKTTASTTVAYALARAGKRTLFVDADSQRNGERTMLARCVNELYDGDWQAFYLQANCQTLLEALA